MTRTRTPVIVRVSHRFRASPERVFDAWLDPATARRFLYATPTGQIVRCDLDARPGGRWTITDRRDGDDVEHTGEYLEIDRPRRLVFTLQVPKYSQASDRVEIEIVPLESGCELTLTHGMGPEGAEWAESTTQGWTGILQTLDAALDGQAS